MSGPRRNPAAELAFLLLAAPSVLRAALRAHRTLRRNGIEDAATELSRAPPFAWSTLARPHRLAAAADRLLPLLPLPRLGRCLKRSLLLVDLWSRCGVTPRLHLGYARHGEEPSFHAWVTSDAHPDLDAPGGLGHVEIWSTAANPPGSPAEPPGPPAPS